MKPSWIACLLAACLAPAWTLAGPSPEQARRYIETRGMPQWQQAAVQARTFPARQRDPRSAATWKALTEEAAAGKAPLVRATTPVDAVDMALLLDWLRWQVLSENADGRYSYAYAANLAWMKDPAGKPMFRMEGAVFLLHARLALTIDGARCLDRTGPEGVIAGFETQPYFAPVLESLRSLPAHERASAWLEAISIEEVRGERPPFPALCNRGPAAMRKARATGRQPVEQPSPPGSPGRTVAIDTTGIEPDLLPEAEWKGLRRQLLDEQMRRAAEMFP